jgi:putative ABC transport system ATP-binding protein
MKTNGRRVTPGEADHAARRSVVALDGVSKQYLEAGRALVVLDSVSVTFNAGEFVVVLGKSGSGKSTLLNLISGIDQPTAGTIWTDGIPITHLSDRERTLFRRKHIGFVFQFFNLIPTLTVAENVLLPLELNGRENAPARRTALGLLDAVGLADRRASFPDRLSGGEQQRVAIARALAHDPLLVLADEPTGNLDRETGEQVLNLLLRLSRATGKTLIMATHSPDVVPLADRVFQIRDGQLIEQTKGELAPELAVW